MTQVKPEPENDPQSAPTAIKGTLVKDAPGDSGGTQVKDQAGGLAPSQGVYDYVYSPQEVVSLGGKDYKVEQHLNRTKVTGQAHVYQVRSGKERLVLKHYKTGKDIPTDVLESLKAHPHRRVVALKDYGIASGRGYEVMDYAEGGTLEAYARNRGGIRSIPELKSLVGQINEGLEFLHNTAGVIYQDLKPDNLFFLGKQKDVVLADFGISSCLEPGSQQAIVRASGTEEYSAPELATKGAQYKVMIDKAVDYFALGVTIWTLWLGKNPFEGFGSQKRDYLILQQNLSFPKEMDSELVRLLKGLLHPLAKDRWQGEQVRKWVAGQALDAVTPQKTYRSMTFIGKEKFANLAELADLLEKHPQQGIDYLFDDSRILEKWLIESDENAMSLAVSKAVKRFQKDPQRGLYLVIHTLNPEKKFVTAAGTVCDDNDALGDALEAEADTYVQELTDSDAKFFLYAEAVGSQSLADRFRSFFQNATPQSALNRLIMELQGGSNQIELLGKTFLSLKDLGGTTDQDVQSEVTKQVTTPDSKLLCWLVHQKILESSGLPTGDGVSLFAVLTHFPWLQADKINPRLGDFACDLVREGRTDLLDTYTKKYSLDVNDTRDTSTGYTPLSLAAELGDPKMVGYLLSRGAGVNRKNTDGSTALIVAIVNQRPEVVELLIKHGAAPNDSWNGVSALGWTFRAGVDPQKVPHTPKGNFTMLNHLLVAKPDPNFRDPNGETVLWDLVRFSGDVSESVQAAERLIRAGAGLGFRNKTGLDVLRYAITEFRDKPAKRELQSVIELFLRHGADPNLLNAQGNQSALMMAADAGLVSLAQLLLRHGAQKGLRDSRGNTAADIAKTKYPQLAAMLSPTLREKALSFLGQTLYGFVKVVVLTVILFSLDTLAQAIGGMGLDAVPLGVVSYVLSLLLASAVFLILTGSFSRFWQLFRATVITPKGIVCYFILLPVFFAPATLLVSWGIEALPVGEGLREFFGSPWRLLSSVPGVFGILVYAAALLAMLAAVHFLTLAFEKLVPRRRRKRKEIVATSLGVGGLCVLAALPFFSPLEDQQSGAPEPGTVLSTREEPSGTLKVPKAIPTQPQTPTTETRPSPEAFSSRLSTDGPLTKDPAENSSLIAALKRGTRLKVTDKKSLPSDTAVISQTVHVVVDGKPYPLDQGTKVRIAVLGPSKSTIAFDVGDSEEIRDVETANLTVEKTNWLRVETQDGKKGWIKSENVVSP